MNKEEYMKIQEGRSADGSYREMSPWAVAFFEKYSEYVEEPILEVGSGNGPVLEYLKEKGLFAIGLDISRPSVWHCLNHDRPVPAIWQDAQDPFPFPDNSFKTVLTFHTIEHCPNPEIVMEHINRVLNGTFCGHFPLGEIREGEGHFMPPRTLEEAKKLFKDFEIIEIEAIHPGYLFIANNKKT